jgi:hypothetical protein
LSLRGAVSESGEMTGSRAGEEEAAEMRGRRATTTAGAPR